VAKSCLTTTRASSRFAAMRSFLLALYLSKSARESVWKTALRSAASGSSCAPPFVSVFVLLY
jgi:hypothetical protein